MFSIFQKVFKPEGKHHIFTLGQLKYQNSLIWMKKEPKSEMRKKCPKGRGGEKLQFFRFFKKFSNQKEMSYFHFWTTKISKFTHFDEKGADE